MEGIINIAFSEQGLWVLLTGLLGSILIGAVKTPIKAKVIPETLEATVKTRREHIFDILVFLSTFVVAFGGASALFAIVNKSFMIIEVLKLTLSVWLSQSLVYGIWKKLGFKKLVMVFLRLFIKDTNNDGEISLSEAIEMVRNAWKNGKLDVDELVKESIDNATENLEKVLIESTQGLEPGKAMVAVEKAAKGEYSEAAKAATEAITNNSGVEIVKDGQKIIKF